MIFAFVTGRKPLFIFYWTQFPSLSINVDVPAAQERAANVNPQSSFMTPFLGAEATNCQCGEPHSPKNANAKIYLFWKEQPLTLCLYFDLKLYCTAVRRHCTDWYEV